MRDGSAASRYVNMAPVFYRLDAEVEEVQGVPTELNRRCCSRASSTSRRSRRSSTRATPTGCGCCRGCASRSEGAVDSIQLVSRKPLEQVRSVAVTPESATSVVLTKVLLPEAEQRAARRGGRREAADRRRGAAERVRGSDAALRPRPPLARAHRAADGVRRLGRARAASRTGSRSSSDALVASRAARARRAGAARAARRASATAIRPASSRATSRSCATASARASAPGCCTFLELAQRRRRARRRARAPLRPQSAVGVTAVASRTVARGPRARRSRASGSPTTRPSTLLRVARPRRRRPRRERDPQPQGRSRPRSRSSSTATSTTRTSASPTATSAPSTAAPATRARATCCRSR